MYFLLSLVPFIYHRIEMVLPLLFGAFYMTLCLSMKAEVKKSPIVVRNYGIE